MLPISNTLADFFFLYFRSQFKCRFWENSILISFQIKKFPASLLFSITEYLQITILINACTDTHTCMHVYVWFIVMLPRYKLNSWRSYRIIFCLFELYPHHLYNGWSKWNYGKKVKKAHLSWNKLHTGEVVFIELFFLWY